jgi:thiamine-monophosphate kinase
MIDPGLPLPEKKLISRLKRAASVSAARTRHGAIIRGIGDDCSVLRVPAGHEVLITTDFSLEGVHFRRDWDSAEAIGHRCLARGLSDIAAMGGNPVAAFLSLALPPELPQRWVDGFIRGLLKLANKFRVGLAGGDTAASGEGVLADIIVVGSVPKGTAVLRSGARPGDRIYVTGSLGGAAQRVSELSSNRGKQIRAVSAVPPLPAPRIEIGKFLRQRRIVSAMIDISDGLSTDLSHICEKSRVGAEIFTHLLPRALAGRSPQALDLKFALHGGDNYELLFTARPQAKIPEHIAGVSVTEIGAITRAKRMTLVERTGSLQVLKPLGWEHFSGHA